jgi:hypothetical protein
MKETEVQGMTIPAGDRDCLLYGEERAPFILIQPTDEHDTEALSEEICAVRTSGIPFLLVSVPVLDWERELVPWTADAPYGNRKFGPDAGKFLERISANVIPEAMRLSLWSSFQTDAFAGCAAASPSVWVDGWTGYADTHAPLARVYSLSLGDREEKAKNPLLRTVGSCMKRQVAVFEKAIDERCGNIRDVQFQMNPGNHFQDSGKRTGDAFAKAMQMCLEAEKN